MREIKLRAWCYIDKKMYYQHLDGGTMVRGFDNSGNNDYYISSIRFPESVCPGHDDIDLMQFTGLLDKNGKEIYDGDIVEKRDFITGITQYYQIVWSDDDCGFICKGKNDSLFNGLGVISKELEIIGNIYENPNLAIK